MEKTNVMRILDKEKREYIPHEYDPSITNGELVAKTLGEEAERVFKTLVTVSDKRKYYVFVIPVDRELDLKKAAKAVGAKSVSMLPQKELLPLTGYVHGGCSPIGMKKLFPTVADESAKKFDRIFFSAGKVGFQVETSAETLAELAKATFADLTAE